MNSKKDRLPARRVSRSVPRSHDPVPRVSNTRPCLDDLWDEDNLQVLRQLGLTYCTFHRG